MVYIKDIINALEQSAPFSLQESYDNSGLQVGSPEKVVTKCLVCIDVTPAVMKEARENGCDLVISHHPLLFHGLKSITGAHYTEQVLIDAIKHDVAVLSVHTNLDASYNGVSSYLAKRLGLVDVEILSPLPGRLKKLVTFCPPTHADTLRTALFDAGAGHIGNYDCCSFHVEGHGTFRAGEGAQPFAGRINEMHSEKELRIETIFPAYHERSVIKALKDNHPYEEVAYDIYMLDQVFDRVGMGIKGRFVEPMPEASFLEVLKKTLHIPFLRHTQLLGKAIQHVAICGGAGGFLLDKAMASGADAFVTAELKYNQFMDATGKILLVDAGHYETEQFTKELLAVIIQEKIINFAVLISAVNTNPVKYG
jgi:dinuclear metal center YbgI/SA1388 family protein